MCIKFTKCAPVASINYLAIIEKLIISNGQSH